MVKRSIAQFIDYTFLKPDASYEMFEELCAQAAERGFYSVCVPPYMVKKCKGLLAGTGVKVVTVAGFPAGYTDTETKVSEIKNAVGNGADEIDAVINVSALKSGDTAYVKDELLKLRKAAGAKTLKVIIETCYLNAREIAEVSKIAAECGADFVKTSTGFGPSGAKLEDIKIIKQSLPDGVRIKASGGIKTYGQAAEFLDAGASRIGTSSALTAEEEIQSGKSQ